MGDGRQVAGRGGINFGDDDNDDHSETTLKQRSLTPSNGFH